MATEVNIKKLYADSKMPTRGSEYAAGYDVYAHLEEESIEVETRRKYLQKKVKDND